MSDSESAELQDDPTIGNDEPLWRRIPPNLIIFDENLGRHRPTSAAFSNHPDGSFMSVVLGNQVMDSGRCAEDIIAGHRGFSLGQIMAKLARDYDQGVVRKPTSQEPAHAEVVGKKTKRVRKAFAKYCEWVIR